MKKEKKNVMANEPDLLNVQKSKCKIDIIVIYPL